MQRVPYASAIGSIMYAVRCTRPNVAFAQNLCSHFQQNPDEIHWTSVKTILKYLRNTKDMVPMYGTKPEAKMKIAQKEEAWIQVSYEKFNFMAAACAYDEIEEVTANCTLKDNLQQASTSGTQTDSALVYDSGGSTEEEICLIEKLLDDNSSPRPPKEINSENSNIESFSPSPISIEDSEPFMEEIDLFLTSDGSIPQGIDSDYSDSEEDNHFPERLLHNDHIPLPDILDSSNVVRVFPPLFTYLATSSILLSFGSEDIIFDPGISDYHLSSLELDVSHRSGTFIKFNVYANHLNESLMEILSSTCKPLEDTIFNPGIADYHFSSLKPDVSHR
nr:hypothetical protein [Tanacetum cinerariifolium]